MKTTKRAPPHQQPRTGIVHVTRRLGWLLGIASGVVFLNQQYAKSYIVCSKSREIYTVDPVQPRVECISVRGSNVVDVGDYGTCARRVNTANSALTCSNVFLYTADLTLSSKHLDSLAGVLPVWLLKTIKSRGRKVIEVEEGSVVLPGLTGKQATWF